MFGKFHSQGKFNIVLHFIKKAEESGVSDAPAFKKSGIFYELTSKPVIKS